jgi:hypothetical protein
VALNDLVRAEEELCNQIRAVEHERELALQRSVQLGDLRRIVHSAYEAWMNADIEDRPALSKAVGNALGGLVLDIDGTLRLGDADDQRSSEAQA